MSLTLLLGGARSGKSALAVRIASGWPEPVTFIATAEAGDVDMVARIARHREERPSSWRCIEEPLDLGAALGRSAGEAAIVDCLTLWVANLLKRRSADETFAEARRVAAIAAGRDVPVVAVSNEVGLGVHPATARGREFRDVLGRVNAIWAEVADEAHFVIAGRALELHRIPSPPTPTDV
jgi:adenosylcobinamide kinase / adenosylcobinamide-phosphate guanylyltransferase